MYTRERPIEEIAPSKYGTFYSPRPLSFIPTLEQQLTKEQIRDIIQAIQHRDNWIESYQGLRLQASKQIQSQAKYIKNLLSLCKAPITGGAIPVKGTTGLYHQWLENHSRLLSSHYKESTVPK